MLRRVVWLLLSLAGVLPAEELRVEFRVNSALEKDRPLMGVVVRASVAAASSDAATATTDEAGRAELTLARGRWFVSYELAGHVPIIDTPLEVGAPGQVVTTSLLPALEGDAATGPPRIALVLNWGSDGDHVKDCDSHLAVGSTHVYFSSKQGRHDSASIHLDVDDMDWGGPETITVNQPGPGRYVYFVHDWSDGPARLGGSEVVVRLLVGDTVAGEWRAPGSATARVWRPFQAIEVAADGGVSVVPFTDPELSAGADRQVPPEVEAAIGWRTADQGAGDEALAMCCLVAFMLPVALGFAGFLFKKALGGGAAKQ